MRRFAPVAAVVAAAVLSVLATVLLAREPVPPDARPGVSRPFLGPYLPPGATDIRVCGYGWYLFTLHVDGRDRRFLYRHHIEGLWGSCVTELQP